MNTKPVDMALSAGGQAHEEITRLEAKVVRHDVGWHAKNIVWRSIGNGPPLILIHGGHGNWLHWIRNVDALAHHHTVWLPDLPGFGDSDDLGSMPHDPDRMQHLIVSLEGTLNILLGSDTLIDLAGFSFGAVVAVRLALQRGRVRRMALLGPAGHGGPRRQTGAMVDWRLPEVQAKRMALRHNLHMLMLHQRESIDPLSILVHERCCTQTRFRSKSFSRSDALQACLHQYKEQVLLVWGEHDVTGVPEDVAPTLAGMRPGHDWCVVPNAGHWVQYERATEINLLLQSWFTSNNAFDEPTTA